MRVLLTYRRARAGSAVHALAQPTPPGEGPEGFLTVLNDALVTTEKVNHYDQNIESLGKAYKWLDEICIQSFAGHHSGHN